MNEEEIIATICDTIQERLGDANVSRNFMTQTLLPQLNQASKLRPEESSLKKAGKMSQADRSISKYNKRRRWRSRRLTFLYSLFSSAKGVRI